MEGATLGKYRLTARIGEGGMGVVYSGTHTVIGRKVAVKLLLPELSKNAEVIERFFNEARAAAKIQHPGIVDILDFGYADDGSAYIAMEFLKGESLGDRIDDVGRLPADDLVRFTRQAASALAEVHEIGIVHRDLKPDNLFLVPDGAVAGGERVKVLDFGIAKLAPSLDGSGIKTRTGSLMGSPTYMSPEQCRGLKDIDARSDIYSLGCVMYEMACGQAPFTGEGVGDIIAKHVYEAPTKVSIRHGCTATPAVVNVIMKTLAKEPDERYQSMTELVTALDEASSNRFATAAVPPPGKQSREGVRTPTAFEKTTLGGAAVEVTHHPASAATRRWPIAVLVVLLLGVGGVVALKLSSSGTDKAVQSSNDQSTATAALADEAPADKALADKTLADKTLADKALADEALADKALADKALGHETPTDETKPAVTTNTTPPDPGKTHDTTAKVTVTIKSKPAGAIVLDSDGKTKGKTPLPLSFAKDSGEHRFVLRSAGHDDKPITVGTTVSRNQRVELTRTVATKSSRDKARTRTRNTSKHRTRTRTRTKTKTPRQKGDPLDPFAE